MKIEELSRDELMRVITTVKDVNPESAEAFMFSAVWDPKGNRYLRLDDERLGIVIQDLSLSELLSRYEIAVEMAGARKR